MQPSPWRNTTADLAWALLMATARRLPAAERWLRNGEWKGWQFIQWLGSGLHHATLGILGMGCIGQTVARRALGFDMKVIYHNRTPLAADQASAIRATWVDKETLLREADFLVLMLPYSPATHHSIGAAELALMKPTAHLINVARGGIVDDEALISALRQRRLSGAALDVFEGEPKLNPDFLELDNVTLTPHDRPVRDSNRKFADNWELSAQRALTVTRTMIEEGVPAASIFAAAFGPEQPVASNADAEGRARTRRVEIAPVPRSAKAATEGQ